MGVSVTGDFSRYVTLRRGEMSEAFKPLPQPRGWHPYFRGVAVPETKKETAPKVEPVLGDAAASGDARVHDLLAQHEIHERNGDKDAAQAVVSRLAELGYKL
jgi:hypothetical protein